MTAPLNSNVTDNFKKLSAEEWKEKSWTEITPLYNEILKHPFIKELQDGTLRQEIFLEYLSQDSLYLKEFAVNMEMLSNMKELQQYKDSFIRFYKETLDLEELIKEKIFSSLNTSALDNKAKNNACINYLNHLRTHTLQGAPEGLAAHLACFWVYAEIGKELKTTKENPYKDWIEGYGDINFEESVKIYLNICCTIFSCQSYEKQLELINIFKESVKHEHEFWDGAYRKQ